MRSRSKKGTVSSLRFLPLFAPPIFLYPYDVPIELRSHHFLCFGPAYGRQIPFLLTVDRKDLFGIAARELGFSVETEETLPVGDEFITVIKVANLPARASFQKETRQFYGEFASTDIQSIQSAYHVALGCLEKEKIIAINDYNCEYVAQLRGDLFRYKSWAMLHEFDAASLRKKVKAVGAGLRELLSSVKNMLGSPEEDQVGRAPKKARYHDAASLLTKSDAASVQLNVSRSLSTLEATMGSILGGSVQDKSSMPRQPKEEGASSSARME